jgi:hypothetical protein
MTGDEQILERLDLIQATLALAFAGQIHAAGDAIRDDRVNAAILDAAQEWIGSTALQEKVAKQLSISTRSVRDRFPGLLAKRVLATRGSENRPEFKSTGLI